MEEKPKLLERLVVVEQKAHAAHSRLDKFESSTAKSLEDIVKDLKDILAWMHQTKGRDRAMVLVTATLSALFGGVLGAVVPLFFKK